MAHHQHRHHDTQPNTLAPVTLAHNARPSEPLHLLDDEAILDVDEPPDNHLMFKRQPIKSPAASVFSDPLDRITEPKQKSLLTQGLSSDTTAARSRSVVSSFSTSSIASAAELTSDGGLTSPTRTNTPSPPVPSTTIRFQPPALKKSETVILNPVEPPKKRCISFACGNPPKAQPPKVETPVAVTETKRPCTIKFACTTRPKETALVEKPVQTKATSPKDDTTPKKLTPKSSFSRSPTVTKKKRPSEALRFHEFASRHLEDDEWVHEKPRRQSKITISDTLKKENEFRKLGEEAAAEAREAELEEDEEAMNAEDDDDEEEVDEDESENDAVEDDEDDLDEDDSEDNSESDGNESDNEAGFADSDDDEVEDNSDYQFWTTGLNTAATSTDHIEHIRLKHRSPSASSIESVVAHKDLSSQPRSPEMKKHRRRPKMRPGTPELPDSTDFVCGTLDEDRPLEAAYRSCIAQRKLAKTGIIPQDLDPTFPTSDPEQDRSDEENAEASNDSGDGTWAAGRFDDFDMKSQRRGRSGINTKRSSRSPTLSPKRTKSPAPKPTRTRVMAHTPPPVRRLFGQSPRRNQSPATRPQLVSPPGSRHSSGEKHLNVPGLAHNPNNTHTKSLPRTPNPFWEKHRRHRRELAATPSDDLHTRGPIDIVQGLENKRRRRKEKFWLTHCRKEAKEKEKDRRRQPPGRGAKRMRELGLEAADRCKGYGPRAQVVLSI